MPGHDKRRSLQNAQITKLSRPDPSKQSMMTCIKCELDHIVIFVSIIFGDPLNYIVFLNYHYITELLFIRITCPWLINNVVTFKIYGAI